MAGITVDGAGFSFVWLCFKEYWGICFFPLLFLVGLLWSLWKQRKKEAGIFFGYAVFLALTVYNPLVVRYVIPKLDFENEYYRFFWILPVIPAVAYYGVTFVWHWKHTWGKVVAALCFATLLILAGTPLKGVVGEFALAENIYKVPDDLRAVCDVIHQDSEKENPKVVFDSRLNAVARQYDASLSLTLSRNAVLYWQGSTVVGNIKENGPWYKRQKIIMDVVYGGEDVKLRKFIRALNKTETDYLVLSVGSPGHEMVRQAGGTAIAQTEDYVVYRYENKGDRRNEQ